MQAKTPNEQSWQPHYQSEVINMKSHQSISEDDEDKRIDSHDVVKGEYT